LAAGKITETVDYYHASEYIHKIAAELPRKLAKRSASILKEFKHWLWEGKIEAILDKCRLCPAKPSRQPLHGLPGKKQGQKSAGRHCPHLPGGVESF
jgi:hypothetical protein